MQDDSYNEYRKAYSKKWHQLNKEKRKQHDAEYRKREGIGVYGVKDVELGTYVYIGSGELAMRNDAHLKFKKGSTSKLLQMLIKMNGKENYTFEVIEKCDEENRIKKEQHYIDLYKPICNIRKAK